MAAFVVASDLGSSGCKSVVVDGGGRVRGAASQDYPTRYPAPGWCEQDPADWLAAAVATTRRAVEQAGIGAREVAAYGVVGVTHNAVLLDGDDEPLRPAILLFDTRSSAQCAAIEARFGKAVHARTRNAVGTMWTWPQLAWLRENEPDVWSRCRRVLFQKDFVRHKLAPGAVTDEVDAAGSLLFDPVAGGWVDPFLDDLGLDPAQLPQVMAPTAIAGRLGAQAAGAMGLAEGTPVIAGTTDTLAEVVGAGALAPGQGTIKLASVGRITAVAERPADDPRIINYRHLAPGLWYPGTATKHASTAYRWLRDILGPDIDFADLTRAAEDVPPGAEGLLFHPHLSGEWAPLWDDRLRGAFIGLDARHGRAHLTRAVMEGVAFALRAALEFAHRSGLDCHDLRLLGGGSSAGLWTQILADVLARPLLLPQERDAAYGAALITGIGAGLFSPDVPSLARHIRIAARCGPRPQATALYNDLYALYRANAEPLRRMTHGLSGFAERYATGRA